MKVETSMILVEKIGCYQISFTLIKSGNYNVSVSINNILIPQIEIIVNPFTVDYTKSITNIISRKSNYVVGEYIQFNILFLMILMKI